MSTPSPDAPLLPPGWIAVVLTAVAAAGVAQVVLLPMNQDEAWHLYMAARVLDGARPYVDVVETNPPLITLLNMGVVALARGLGLPALSVLPAVMFALIAISLGLGWRLSRGLPLALRQGGLVVWAYLLLVNVQAMFGQREHLLITLTLPYAYAAVAEARGDRPHRSLAVVAGLMAGVGFAIKPFFVPTAVAVEVFLACRRGPRVWFRPEAVAMTAVFLGYAAVVVVWTPQYFPMARAYAPLYTHHGPMGPVLLESSWRLPLVAAGVIFGLVVGRRLAPGWGEVFAILAAGFTAALYATGKGWIYHWLPPCSVASAQFCGGGVLAATRVTTGRRRALAVAGLGLMAPALAVFSVVTTASDWRDGEPLRLVRENVGRGESLLVLSPWLGRAFPLVNEAGVSWGMRHPMVWQIAAFYADGSFAQGGYHALGGMTGPERRFVGEVARDFARSRPALLMVDDVPPRPLLKGFDYVRYFSADPLFSETLADYELLTRTIDFRVYRRRRGRPVVQNGTIPPLGVEAG